MNPNELTSLIIDVTHNIPTKQKINKIMNIFINFIKSDIVNYFVKFVMLCIFLYII